jgi:epoxyqueuosine reductase
MIEDILKSHLIPSDRFIYGFADLSGILKKKFNGYDYGISIGRRLDNGIIDKIKEGPTKEYYRHYRQVNEELATLTNNISADLKKNNIESIEIEPTIPSSERDSMYFKTLKADISHKMVATRAGLGWIGKTDLFISKKFGPRLRLVSILLKAPVINRLRPVDSSRCGTCNICVDVCPAKAANGKLWNINVEREEFFDPWRCRAQCVEFGRLKFGFDARVCGICVAVCPIGQKKRKLNGRDYKSY